MFPYGWNQNRKKPNTASDKAKKLKQVRKHQPIDTTKYEKCPSCGRNTVYYMGVTPTSVYCANPNCRWYKDPNE